MMQETSTAAFPPSQIVPKQRAAACRGHSPSGGRGWQGSGGQSLPRPLPHRYAAVAVKGLGDGLPPHLEERRAWQGGGQVPGLGCWQESSAAERKPCPAAEAASSLLSFFLSCAEQKRGPPPPLTVAQQRALQVRRDPALHHHFRADPVRALHGLAAVASLAHT